MIKPHTEAEEREGFIKDLSALLAGVQVPMSMGVLGAAREPAVALRHRLPGLGFGWYSKEEAEEALRGYLKDRWDN